MAEAARALVDRPFARWLWAKAFQWAARACQEPARPRRAQAALQLALLIARYGFGQTDPRTKASQLALSLCQRLTAQQPQPRRSLSSLETGPPDLDLPQQGQPARSSLFHLRLERKHPGLGERAGQGSALTTAQALLRQPAPLDAEAIRCALLALARTQATPLLAPTSSPDSPLFKPGHRR